MNKTAHPSATRFKVMVCSMLQLPTSTPEKALKNALKLKGSNYLEWYETRLGAIETYIDQHPSARPDSQRRHKFLQMIAPK